MEWLSPALMAVQVISSLSVIVLVLLQQGKGADMGSAFGSGSAGSVFGAAGAANFLSRTTKWAAIIFFVSTAGLAWMSHQPESGMIDGGVMQGFEVPQAPGSVPVAPQTSIPAAPADASVSGAGQPASNATAADPSVPSVGQSAGDASVPAVPAAKPAGEGAQQSN